MDEKEWSEERKSNAIYNYGKYNESIYIRNKNLSLLTPVFAKKNNAQIDTYEKHPKNC